MAGVYKQETWVCPICKNIYNTEAEAVKCWNTHYTLSDIEIEEMEFDSHRRFPEYIFITSKNGDEATYKKVL